MRVTKAIKAEQLKLLQEHYFDAKPALEYTNEFELLVAVVYLHNVRMRELISLLNGYFLN